MHNSFNAGQDSNFNFLRTKHFSQSLGKQALIEAPSAPSSSKGSYFPKERTSSDNSRQRKGNSLPKGHKAKTPEAVKALDKSGKTKHVFSYKVPSQNADEERKSPANV